MASTSDGSMVINVSDRQSVKSSKTPEQHFPKKKGNKLSSKASLKKLRTRKQATLNCKETNSSEIENESEDASDHQKSESNNVFSQDLLSDFLHENTNHQDSDEDSTSSDCDQKSVLRDEETAKD